jgi:transposase-like protein
MLTVVHDAAEANDEATGHRSLLDEIVRVGARQMLAAALQAEVAAYVAQFVDQLDEEGHRLVVRNGYHQAREVLTAAGAVEVKAPRVTAVSTPILASQWQDEAAAFGRRDLSGSDYVYLWVDGIHLRVRLDQEKLCLLVMLGVRADGRKELVAITDGYRESTESWADLLRDCRRRGMAAPVLAVGDGPLGFWKAMREVFPATREQRCWFHKQANVLAGLPKSAHPTALAAMREIYNAEDIDKAQVAVKTFEVDFGAKYPKVVAKIVDDLDTLLEFYKYPAEHWIHLRTTNPIESTFATVRLRTNVTKGSGSRAAGLAMAYKLIDAAQTRWRAVNASHLVALLRAGAVFHKGKLLERPADITPPQSPPDGDQHTATDVA